AHRGPVDESADPPAANEPVAYVEVAVVPGRRSVPGRCGERTLPLHLYAWIAIEALEPEAELPVALRERDATPGWCVGRAQLLERADERGKVARRLDCVDLLDRHRLTLDPDVDLPEPRVVEGRVALRDRDRDLDREERSEHGQPVEQLPAGLGRA